MDPVTVTIAADTLGALTKFAPVNPEAIAIFGLFVAVMCFGLEQIGVGLKGADMQKVTKTLALLAIMFGGVTQLFAAVFMYLFGFAGPNSIYLGTVFGFFGLFWVTAGIFFLMGGDKKVMAHFFACGLFLCLCFTQIAFEKGLIWPLAIDLVVIDFLLLFLIIGWYTGNPLCTRLAGICNIVIGIISLFLLFPQLGMKSVFGIIPL